MFNAKKTVDDGEYSTIFTAGNTENGSVAI